MQFSHTASPAITRVSLTPVGFGANDG